MSACGSKRELKREEKKLKEYLKAKYNDEFVINKLDYYIPQIGSLMIKGTASPKENKDIIFKIVSTPADKYGSDKFGEDYKKNMHYDNYLGHLWRPRANEIYSKFCNDIWDEKNKTITIRPYGGQDLLGDLFLNDSPKYDYALEKYPEKLSIIIEIEFIVDDFNIENEAKKILSLINKIRVPKFENYQLTFIYLEDNNRHAFTVWKSNIEDIQTVDDVKKEYYVNPIRSDKK
jgi:hypothetical protein